jgi:hypothetical protein
MGNRFGPPHTDPGFVRTTVRVGCIHGGGAVSRGHACPLGVRLIGLGTERIEVHRAHPQAELHRGDRIAYRVEIAIRESRRICQSVVAMVRTIRIPVAGVGLPPVVEDERIHSERSGLVGDVHDRVVVHVVLGSR